MEIRKKPTQWEFLVLPVVILLYLSLWLSLIIRYGSASPLLLRAHLIAFTPVHLLWLLVLFAYRLFEVHALRRFTNTVAAVISAMAVNVLLAGLYFYAQPNLILTPRRFLLLHGAVSLVLIIGWYALLKYLFKKRFIEYVYFVGVPEDWGTWQEVTEEYGYMGVKNRGVVSVEQLRAKTDLAVGGTVSVIFPERMRADTAMLQALYTLRNQGVTFYNAHDFSEHLRRRIMLEGLDQLWFLENVSYAERRLYNLVKRVADILAGLSGFLAFIITFPLIAPALLIDSGRPIFFSQERLGKNGHAFTVYKYRTMKRGSATNTWTAINDPRMTGVGRFLRTTRLDELPQCINLLVGNMSVVGPRPEQLHIVEELERQIPFYGERHFVKPGITGWAQLHVYAGSFEETKLKLEYDLYYIKHRSFRFDAEIIIKTLYYIFTWSGR